MKLELFNYIDDVMAIYDFHRLELVEINKELKRYFNNKLQKNDEFINIFTRIKSKDSLKEKIIRRNYFVKYPNPADGFNQIPDLIGLRIECRFIKDEEQIYKKIIEDFRLYTGGGMYASKLNKKIRLNLDDPQPQSLNNGFKIFKLDGEFFTGERTFLFELQIKSLVNVFWGEIDHKILYKNYNYVVTADFFKDIMNSIIDNLTMVDRQLMLLYDHVRNLDASVNISAEIQLKTLLSKILHDVFTQKIYDELGLMMNLKTITDVVVNFLFMKSIKNKDLTYGENFISLINRINLTSNCDMNIEEPIELKKEPKYYDSFSKGIGEILYVNMNKDLEWNLFFKIISLINEASYSENFTEFLIFVRYEYTISLLKLFDEMGIDEDRKDYIESELLGFIVEAFKENPSLDFLMGKSLTMLNDFVCDAKRLETKDEEKIIEFFKDTYKYN